MHPVRGRLCWTPYEPEEPAEPGRWNHANPTPSASGQATAALAAAAVRLRAHHGSPGCPRRLGHPAAPAPTATPRPRGRAAHLVTRASTNVRIDHHHRRPGTDHHDLAIHHSRPRAGGYQRTGHNHPTGHRPSAGQERRRDHPHRTPVLWRHHHPAHRNHTTDHGQAIHDRRTHHGSAHDHAGDHDQHRVHHHQHPAHDRTDDDHPGTDDDQPDTNDDHRGVDHDGAGNDHHQTSHPRWQPTSQQLGRHNRDAPARPRGALPAARAPAPGGRQTRQAAATHQPPRPPRLSHRPPDPGRQQAAKRDRRHIPRSAGGRHRGVWLLRSGQAGVLVDHAPAAAEPRSQLDEPGIGGSR
jgi:hypothetical protein